MQYTPTSQWPMRPFSFRLAGFLKVSSQRISAIGVACMLVAFGALAQEAEPLPPVFISLDGVPTNASASVHDFTRLPLTADGWTDLDAMMLSADYASSRFVYVSNDGGSGRVYTQAQVAALGGTPMNPTTAPVAYSDLSTAWAQVRNGQADVILLRRGHRFGSLSIDKTGLSNSARLIVAAYGPEREARPVASVTPHRSSNNVVLSSIQHNISSTSVPYNGGNVLVEDVLWSGPENEVNEITLPMLNGGSSSDLGGGTVRRSTTSRVVFFAGDWGGSPQTPSRFEENTISRGPNPALALKHNIYFSEGARNIQSIRNQSLLSGGAGWRQRRGGLIRETMVLGTQDWVTWGGTFDVMDQLTFQNNLSLHVHGPERFSALNNADISGNIATAFKSVPAVIGAVNLISDYHIALGGWRGANVFSDNIVYSAASGPALWMNADVLGVFQPGATLAFNNNTFMKAAGGQIFQVQTDARVSYSGNKYYSSAAPSTWFGGRTYEQMIPSTGDAITPGFYPDPDRNLITYIQSLGVNPSSAEQAVEWYTDGVPGNPSLAGALANRRGAWDERFTSIAVINYIREGFGLPRL